MSLITFNIATPMPASAPVRKNRGLLSRLFHRYIEYREAQAAAMLHRHRFLLPEEMEQAGWKISERSEDSLPFVR